MIRTLATITCNGQPLAIENCTRFRTWKCGRHCALFGELKDGQCASCGLREPILTDLPSTRRGLGDVVAMAVTILFLGRSDLAERLAARIEGLFRRRPAPDPAPGKPGVRKPCGCKQRQAALNRAIPFQRNAH